MAYIRKRERKKGVVYEVEVRIKDHPPVSQSFDREIDARIWARDTEDALRSGGYIGEARPTDMQFETAMDKYIDTISPTKALNTSRREVSSANNLHKYFDGKTLKQITPQMVAEYRDHRKKSNSSNSTIRKEMILLSQVFKVARAEWSCVDLVDPTADVKKPPQTNERLRFLTKEEATALMNAARESRNKKLNIFILLMLQSGMRPGECAGLTWDRVDLKKRYINLTVTKTRPRLVPLTKPAVAALSSLDEKEGYVFLPESVSSYVKSRPERYFYRSFKNAVVNARIDDFTMHDMRHTAASHLLMTEKVDLITLADILGHKSLDMTKRYAHLLKEHKIKAIDHISWLGVD